MADLDLSDRVAIAALVIALVSLLNAIVQLFQQYFVTAEGLRRCQPSVLGPWSEKTHLHFRWKQFRLETHFTIPVFGFDTTENRISDTESEGHAKGDERMFVIDGDEMAGVRRVDGIKYRFTPETVTWLYLLESLYGLGEATFHELGILRLPGRHCVTEQAPSRDLEAAAAPKPSLDSNAVEKFQFPAIRLWERSWDVIPPDVIRPLAISDLSSISRIAIRLGMSWRQFDVANSVFHAHGNGMIIVSTSSRSMATTLQFDSEGATKVFDSNTLLVPREESDMLAFGIIKPWYEGFADVRAYLVPSEFGFTGDFLSYFAGIPFMSVGSLDNDFTSVLGDVLPLTACMMRIRGSSITRIPNIPRLFGFGGRFVTGLTSQRESLVAYREYIENLPEEQKVGQIQWISTEYAQLADQYKGWEHELGEASDIIGNVNHLDDIQNHYDVTFKYFKTNEGKNGLKYYDLMCAFFYLLQDVYDHVMDEMGRDRGGSKRWARDGMKKYLDSMNELTEQLRTKGFTGSVEQVREAFLMMIFRAICWNRCHLLVDRGTIDSEYWNSRLLVYIV